MSAKSRVICTALFGAILGALSFTGCGGSANSPWANATGPKVAVSFAPIYCFATNVAGPDATIQSVMSNQGPHHFDPTPNDARLIAGADLFIINGLTLDNRIAEKMMRGAGNSKLKLIDLGKSFDPKSLLEMAHNHEGHDHAHHDHEHGEHDPHVWLGLDQAELMVNAIRDALKDADPAKAANYDRRAAEYIAKLRKLKADGVELFKDKKNRNFVTFHESLGYLAATFKLEVVDVIQKTPGKEPTAKELDRLIKLCTTFQSVRVIAVEPQYSTQTSAKRILDELKAKGVHDAVLVEIDPLETANPEELTPEWYEMKMRKNLEALAQALK